MYRYVGTTQDLGDKPMLVLANSTYNTPTGRWEFVDPELLTLDEALSLASQLVNVLRDNGINLVV